MIHRVYSALLGTALAVGSPWFLWKGRRSGRYTRTLPERLGRLPPELGADPRSSAWIHAVSVGEALVVRPLLAPLRERLPELRLLVSTTTPTGQEIARTRLKEADAAFYAPLDLRRPVVRALEAARPRLLVLVETELWPNLIHEAHARGVKVAVVNGRISPRSFPRYRRLRGLLRGVLAEVDLFLMQAQPHAERVIAIGAPPERVRVSGNLKYDLPDPHPSPELAALVGGAGGPLWIAGSTAPGEEELVLRALLEVRARVPTARLVLAPRHPERFEEVAALVAARGLRVARRSTAAAGWGGAEVLVLDTLGELAHAYPLASAVFVGGSLVPSGGHNVLEAAVAGRAVVVGPHMENFQEIAREFLAEDALVQVPGPEALGAAVSALLADRARREAVGGRARALLERNRGAVLRTADALAALVRA